MVLSAVDGESAPSPAGDDVRSDVVRSDAVIWHELECGAYTADLPLWREIAGETSATSGASTAGPQPAILDVGAGSGRVTLDLARRGHQMTALDLDAELLDALQARAANLPVQTVCADARTFQLENQAFALCIAPMQTVQLLDGSTGRIAFLTQAHAHLKPGGLLACAIVTELDPFDCAAGDLGPSPEVAHSGGARYISQATRVRVGRQSIRIERQRQIVRAQQAQAPAIEHNVIELDRVSATRLVREARQIGFTAAGVRSVSATDEHVGSEVVLLHV